MQTKYIVMSSVAKMPLSCWGRYKRVAVVEVVLNNGEPVIPKMISTHARGVVKVVKTWERLNFGKTFYQANRLRKCAYEKALDEANEFAKQLNNT